MKYYPVLIDEMDIQLTDQLEVLLINQLEKKTYTIEPAELSFLKNLVTGDTDPLEAGCELTEAEKKVFLDFLEEKGFLLHRRNGLASLRNLTETILLQIEKTKPKMIRRLFRAMTWLTILLCVIDVLLLRFSPVVKNDFPSVGNTPFLISAVVLILVLALVSVPAWFMPVMLGKAYSMRISPILFSERFLEKGYRILKHTSFTSTLRERRVWLSPAAYFFLVAATTMVMDLLLPIGNTFFLNLSVCTLAFGLFVFVGFIGHRIDRSEKMRKAKSQRVRSGRISPFYLVRYGVPCILVILVGLLCFLIMKNVIFIQIM